MGASLEWHLNDNTFKDKDDDFECEDMQATNKNQASAKLEAYKQESKKLQQQKLFLLQEVAPKQRV